MEKGIIITMPNYDNTTEYLSQWSYDIIKKAQEKSISIRKIEGKDVAKENLEKSLNKLNFKMLVFNGHGTEDSIFGHNNKIVINKKDNGDLLIDRIVYARSCNSAASLGKISEKSNGCFIGYQMSFMFYVDSTWTGNPRKDPVADIFLSPSNQLPISIIKGNTCKDSHENSKKQIIKNMNKILKKRTSDSYRIAEALLNNYFAQTLIGNENAIL